MWRPLKRRLCDALLADLNRRLVFSKWEFNIFDFCGKDLKFGTDETELGQETFAKDIRTSPISRARRAEQSSPLEGDELTELRSGRGSLQWMAGQSRPDLAAAVSLNQVPQPTIATLLSINKLLEQAKASSQWKLRIRKMIPDRTMTAPQAAQPSPIKEFAPYRANEVDDILDGRRRAR